MAIICPSPITYARRGPITTTASHSSRYDMLAIISSRYHYGPFLFFLLQKLCQITWLLTGWKISSLLPEAPLRPEARGICHICHMVNPTLVKRSRVNGVPELIPVLGSQPAGDVSHIPGGRLPLLSARPAVTPATLKRAATNFSCLVNKGTMGVNSLPKTVFAYARFFSKISRPTVHLPTLRIAILICAQSFDLIFHSRAKA